MGDGRCTLSAGDHVYRRIWFTDSYPEPDPIKDRILKRPFTTTLSFIDLCSFPTTFKIKRPPPKNPIQNFTYLFFKKKPKARNYPPDPSSHPSPIFPDLGNPHPVASSSRNPDILKNHETRSHPPTQPTNYLFTNLPHHSFFIFQRLCALH